MNSHFKEIILKSTKALDLFEIEMIQQLWSGYGHIRRYGLKGSEMSSVVVKHVRLPKVGKHPRGWNTDYSHERKVRSYEVETQWYSKWSHFCDANCHVPNCLAYEDLDDEVLMVLEDLDGSGYGDRRSSVDWHEIEACLFWLANFHATFMGLEPEGLWDIGTYWHLDTRPDELKILTDKKLKEAAPVIDKKLNDCKYMSFVHGDAKLANFCFAPDGHKVAAVDFQYVGGGCGMKDVAYFISSCMYEDDCEKYETQLLDFYFASLNQALIEKESNMDLEELETEWREMYPFAWTDFHRFLKGWSPGHWKINGYSERLSCEVLDKL